MEWVRRLPLASCIWCGRASNVRGAQLLRDDSIEHPLEGERLNDGGQSRVSVRVANVLPYTGLRTLAYQGRHEKKDAYDLLFTLPHHDGGPRAGALPQ